MSSRPGASCQCEQSAQQQLSTRVSRNDRQLAGRALQRGNLPPPPSPSGTCALVLAKDVVHPTECVVLCQRVIASHCPADTGDTLTLPAPPIPPRPAHPAPPLPIYLLTCWPQLTWWGPGHVKGWLSAVSVATEATRPRGTCAAIPCWSFGWCARSWQGCLRRDGAVDRTCSAKLGAGDVGTPPSQPVPRGGWRCPGAAGSVV